jgi:hypothetical protein
VGRARHKIIAVSVAALLAAGTVACTRPVPGPSPGSTAPPAAGGAVVGVNPAIDSTPGARRTTLTYGPWEVSPTTGPAHDEQGMLAGAAVAVRKPCTYCYLTGFWADLKGPGGQSVNTDTGQWLHHVVLLSTAGTDPRCGRSGVGVFGERFFASGNERTRARFPAGYGYPVGGLDVWTLVYEMMNETPEMSSLSVDITYEWVPATTAGMKPLRPAWLDVATCDTSTVPAGTGAYDYTGSWTVNRPGNVIGIGGHLHDGGTKIDLVNESTGDQLCTMTAGYGGPGYEGMAAHGPGAPHASHLSSMTQCVAPTGDRPVGRLASGDQVVMTAHYDADQHPQHGDHPVMGIVILFVAAA